MEQAWGKHGAGMGQAWSVPARAAAKQWISGKVEQGQSGGP
jgi:hypothetical protein